MRLMLAGRAIVVVAALLAVATTVPGPARAQDPATVKILFDLGDGSYYWSTITIPDRFAPNATWQATLTAAGQHGLWVSWIWHPVFGIGVSDIGDRQPPSGLAGLFLWNRTARAWDPTSVGVSGLFLADGDAIAWDLAAFDSITYAMRTPVPTPDNPTPSIEFRNDGVSGPSPGLQAVGTGSSASEAPDSETVLWDRDLGAREIEATPAVANGTVFVNTRGGLFALDAASGATRWTNAVVRGFSSPAVFDGSVIVGGSDGRVYRVRAADGREQWNTSLLSQTVFSGITSSPRVAFDRAYIGTFNESGGPGEVVSLWVSNGTVAWRHPTGSVHYSSPAVLRGTVYVGVMGRYNTTTQVTFDPPFGLLALYASNGTARWFSPTGGPVAASPLVTGSLVVASSRDGFVYGISMFGGIRVWRTNVGAGVSSPSLYGDTVLVGTGAMGGGGNLTALDRVTGAVRWRSDTGGPVEASPVVADGKAYFSTNAPVGAIVSVNASSGQLVWSHTPSPAEYILASPALSNGTLFAPSDNGHVYAFRDSRRALANLTVTPLGEIAPVLDHLLDVNVRAEIGSLYRGRLVVTLPPDFEVVTLLPFPARRNGTVLEYDVGYLRHRLDLTLAIWFRAPDSAVGRPGLRIFANLTYTDNDGTAYPPLNVSHALTVRGGTVGQDNPVVFWAVVGLALVVGVVVTALIVIEILRRRNRDDES